VSYWIRYLYPEGVWKNVLWLRLLIYGPFFLLLLLDALRRIPGNFTRGLARVETDSQG
jgi:uncharacterized protein (DUF983 family)